MNDSTMMVIALLTLMVTAIGVFYTYKSFTKKDPSTAKVIGIGDATNGDKVMGDKVGGDKVMGDKIVNEKDKS
ncbi:hypothetical protein [Sulfurimonas sp. HSL-1716]|uniref:hypothetical protein n=1 Tax=Hydrocurvibacter sulfurireducens TaxID=3131937 RepID=UPI0031F7443D